MGPIDDWRIANEACQSTRRGEKLVRFLDDRLEAYPTCGDGAVKALSASDQPGHVRTLETGIDVHDSNVRCARVEHAE